MNFKLVTFDVYTALVDLATSLVPRLDRACAAAGVKVDTLDVLRTWRTKQLEYTLISNSLGKPRIPFRTATRRALDYTLERYAVALSGPEHVDLVNAWDRLTLWPDAEGVLREMKARAYPCAILSNGDADMLQRLTGHWGIEFDYIFSSEQAGCYKPHPAIYALPFQQLGIARGELLHVAGSPTDAMGAKAAGLRCAWPNRLADRVLDPVFSPDYALRDLTGLLALL